MSGLMQHFHMQSKALRVALFVAAFFSGVAFAQSEAEPITYGPADFELRHRYIGSFKLEVPHNLIGSGWKNLEVKGWQLIGIFNFQTGAPFTVFDCAAAFRAEAPCPRIGLAGNVDPRGFGLARPDLTIPNRFVHVDSSRFVTAGVPPVMMMPPFMADNIGRNFFRGTNFWKVDLGVSKRLNITEKIGLQFRGECFNLFNNADLFVPKAAGRTSAGYQPALKSGRRHFQLSFTFSF